MKNLTFLKQNLIAHRGDFDNKRIPENSILAFGNAIRKNCTIELDVHLTKDNEVIVMHDDDVSRMTGGKGFIKDLTLLQLKELNLINTQEKIPTLKEALDLVNGKVPLIIELKYDRKVGELESKLVEILDKYMGKFAVKSFNPLSMRWFKKNRPEYVRGLLIADDYNEFFKNIFSKNLFIRISKPDFISCNFNLGDDKKIRNIRKKKIVIAWTIRNKEVYKKIKGKFDNFICENIDLLLQK